MVKKKATFAAGCFWGVEAEFRDDPRGRGEQVGYTSGDASMQRTRRVCSGSGVGSPVPLWTPTTCLSARRRSDAATTDSPVSPPDGSPRFSSPRRSGSIASGTPNVSGRRRFRAPRTRHPVWRGAKSAQGDSETSSDLALPIPRTRLDPACARTKRTPSHWQQRRTKPGARMYAYSAPIGSVFPVCRT